MYGWHLKILRVNLTTRKVTTEDVDPKVARDYLGGRGWAIHYMYQEMDPMVDPLSPENMLIFATGPLTATPAPTGNRYMVVTKSPLTGALAHSNSGGEFPTWMKRTGFDMFIFEGKASEPVYVIVNEDQVEVPSRFDPATFASHPEMEAYKVTDELLKRLAENTYHFIVVNFANGDMVGHTGDTGAAVRAIEIVDEC